MTAPVFIYTSEPWAALSFGRPIFGPSIHEGANECGSFAPSITSVGRGGVVQEVSYKGHLLFPSK
jgi:hypothetical protein